MLRKLTRWVFSFNALYQGGVGLLALVAPSLTIWLYGGTVVDQGSPYLHALFRMIGAMLVFVGLISALIAKDPDASPVLLMFMSVLSGLMLACWGLALGAGDVVWSQVSMDIVLQIPVLLASSMYYPVAKRRAVDTIELLMSPSWRSEPAREVRVEEEVRVS